MTSLQSKMSIRLHGLVLPNIFCVGEYNRCVQRAWLYLEHYLFQRKICKILSNTYVEYKEEEFTTNMRLALEEVLQCIGVVSKHISPRSIRMFAYLDGIIGEVKRDIDKEHFEELANILKKDWDYIVNSEHKQKSFVPMESFQRRIKQASNHSFYLNVLEFDYNVPDFLRPSKRKGMSTKMLCQMLERAKQKRMKLSSEVRTILSVNSKINKQMRTLNKQRWRNAAQKVKAAQRVNDEIRVVINDCLTLSKALPYLKNVPLYRIDATLLKKRISKLKDKIQKYEESITLLNTNSKKGSHNKRWMLGKKNKVEIEQPQMTHVNKAVDCEALIVDCVTIRNIAKELSKIFTEFQKEQCENIKTLEKCNERFCVIEHTVDCLIHRLATYGIDFIKYN